MVFHPSSGIESSTAGTVGTTMPPAEPFCASTGFSDVRSPSVLGWFCDRPDCTTDRQSTL